MWIEILILCVGLFLALYLYVTRHFGRFKKLNIPYTPGSFPFGSYNFLRGVHIDEMSEEYHKQFSSARYFGHFLFGKPFIGINDPDVLRMIQVKDFDHFVDRISPESNAKAFKGDKSFIFSKIIFEVKALSICGTIVGDIRQMNFKF